MLKKLMIDEILDVAQTAAIAASKWTGRGDEKKADQAAVEAMRAQLSAMSIDGMIAIGEGERDDAPMLYIGEKLGKGGPKINIAVDPLEGTTLCAKAMPNSLAVIAITDGKFLHAPDVYMEKIAIGPGYPEDFLDLDEDLEVTVKKIAKYKNTIVQNIGVMVLDRPRHAALIEKLRQIGVKLYLISDGDISAVIATTQADKTGVDLYVGTGGAPEGVLAAAALQSTGGQIVGRLIFNTDIEKQRAYKTGIKDLDKKYNATELADGNIIFVATGVTDGWLTRGVSYSDDAICTESLVLLSHNKTMRFIKEIKRV